MTKPEVTESRPQYNNFPDYSVVFSKETECFHCGCAGKDSSFYCYPSAGSIIIEFYSDMVVTGGLRDNRAIRVELAGGKGSWTRLEINKKANEIYNEINMFLIAANSWVFSFAE